MSSPKTVAALLTTAIALLLGACSTTTTIDEYRDSGMADININENEKMVVLGRRHLGDYETEPDLIKCIGRHLKKNLDLDVVAEQEFVDRLYPWFEPRTAPLKLRRMKVLMSDSNIAGQMATMGVRYMVWVDGNTETTDSQGSLNCAIGPGGGGCFGFASWDRLSSYEAIIWDITTLEEKGRVRVETEGTSFMIAVVAPVPFVAQVQSEACEGMGNRLTNFFDGK